MKSISHAILFPLLSSVNIISSSDVLKWAVSFEIGNNISFTSIFRLKMQNKCGLSEEPCDKQQLTFNIFELAFVVIAVTQSGKLRVIVAGYKRLLPFLTAS